jgi:signal transduction histidine kinase/CheY-like chemotaxis protein
MTGDGLARLGVDGSTFVGQPLDVLFLRDPDSVAEDRGLAAQAHGEAVRGHAGSYRMAIEDRIFQLHVEPLLVDGRIIGTIGLGLDLTDRLELEGRLERSTRLESIGRLAGGVAHDFNNLLTAITGYADLLTASLPDGEQRHDAEQIRRAGQRAAELTGQLLAFGRRQVLKPELIQPNDVIAEMRPMLARLIGEDVLFDVELERDLPLVMADPGQLEQVIVNLSVNARDAMPNGGRLTITTSRATMMPAGVEPDPLHGGQPVEAISIRVQDTGSGMDEATQARIFEPFYTTKGRGKGTGLGLSTVYGIVEQSGGSIRVESAPAAGTTFTILLAAAAVAAEETVRVAEAPPSLPVRTATVLAANAADAGAERSAEVDPLKRRPTILVAEDETAVRELVVHILTAAGCTVIAAVDGRDGLLVADRHPRIDALVSDVMMPRLNGPQLAAQLHLRMPDLPVLFMSGFTGDVLGERGVMDPGVELLTKPFLPAELLDRVRAILRARPVVEVDEAVAEAEVA